MNRAVFLDRDGIINAVVMRGDKVSSPWIQADFRLLDGADQLITELKKRGYLVIVATNQPDVEKGFIELRELTLMHKEIEKLGVDGIEVCMSADNSDPRRKPNPGMLLEASRRFIISLEDSYFVGDGEKDILAGQRAGVKTVLIETSYNNATHGKADFNCRNFQEVLSVIKE